MARTLSVGAVVLAVLAAVDQLVAGRAGTPAWAVAISAVILAPTPSTAGGAPCTARPRLHVELRRSDGITPDPYPALAAAQNARRVRSVGALADAPVLAVIEVAGLEGACWLLTARGEVVALDAGAAIGATDGGPCPHDGRGP